jgi:hypothetical protein
MALLSTRVGRSAIFLRQSNERAGPLMRTEYPASSTRLSDSANLSTALITEWATRVMDLWEQSRAWRLVEDCGAEDLGDACRVRDQLNNRLARIHPDDSGCTERSLETLRDADAFFLQFTVESSTAEALSRHDHYAHRAEWWWLRHPRAQAA